MLRVRTVINGVAGAPYLSTFYFGGLDNQTGANAAAAAVGTFWNAVDGTMLNTATWATEAGVAQLNPDGTLTGLYNTTPASGTANGGSSALPFATQGLIRWGTGVYEAGREVRGRTFIPALTTAAMGTNGLPTGATMAVWNNAAAVLLADASANLVIWSRKNETYSVAATGAAWGNFAVLRSRRT